MHWRTGLYITIGVGCISWIILSILDEISGPFDKLSWVGLSLYFVPGVTLILIGGSMILDSRHLLEKLGINLNFYPPAYQIRGAGCICLIAGLAFFGAFMQYFLSL